MAQQAHSLAGNRVWARRRGRAAPLLVAISATVFVVAFCVSAIVGFGARSSLAGVRSSLSTPAAAMTLRAPAAANTTTQDAGVRAVIAKVFDGAPLTVKRTPAPGGSSDLRWTITPNSREVTAGDVGKLVNGFAAVEAAVTKSKAAHSSAAELSGRGARTAQATLEAINALGGVELIPLTVLALAGLVALALARSLLSDYRRNETRFLRSRGSSGSFLTSLDVRESVLACLVGAVVGTIAAQLGLGLLVGPPSGVAEVVVPMVVVFVVALAVNWALAGVAARAAAGTPKPESGRVRAAAPLTLCGFGVAIAVIAYWRFEQSAGDRTSFASDPSAIFAPGALLCAGVLLCVLAAGQVTSALERGLRNSSGTRLFPVRSVNRSITVLAGPTALLALAVAIGMVTSAYSGSWQRFVADSQQLTTGGDLRASTDAQPVLTGASDLVAVPDYASVPGVRTAAVASRQDDTFGEGAVTVVAVAPSALPRLLSSTSTVASPTSLASLIAAPATVGIRLPAGATDVGLSSDATTSSLGTDATQQTTLWLADARGDLFPSQLGRIPLGTAAPGTASQSVKLPAAGGPWTIEAIDVGIESTSTLKNVGFLVRSVNATVNGQQQSVPIADQHWKPVNAVFANGISNAVSGVGFSRKSVAGSDIGEVAVRMMPAGNANVPVVLSAPFAASNGLVVGSPVAVDGQFASFVGRVKAVVPAVPGSTSGYSMLAGLPALDRGWLATSEQLPPVNEVWMASSHPVRAAALLASRFPAATVTIASSSSNTSIVAAATTSLWIGAIGTSVFAIIALLAAVAALVRRRSIEVFALRALGLRASRQAALRRRELNILGVIAIIVGLVIGAAVSLLVATTMAEVSTPTAPAALLARFEFDPLPALATVALLLVAFVACWIGYGAAVARAAKGRAA